METDNLYGNLHVLRTYESLINQNTSGTWKSYRVPVATVILEFCHQTKCGLQNGDKINLLKPTGYVMHQQFNIQQLYVVPTLYLCVLYLSENRQRLVPLTA